MSYERYKDDYDAMEMYENAYSYAIRNRGRKSAEIGAQVGCAGIIIFIIVVAIFALCSCSPGKHIQTWICTDKQPIENGYYYTFRSLSGEYGRDRIKDSLFASRGDTLRWKIIRGMDYIKK